jgi:hypothetical protein
MEVTSHPLATANLQTRDPTKPFPPHTTSRFAADMVAGYADGNDNPGGENLSCRGQRGLQWQLMNFLVGNGREGGHFVSGTGIPRYERGPKIGSRRRAKYHEIIAEAEFAVSAGTTRADTTSLYLRILLSKYLSRDRVYHCLFYTIPQHSCREESFTVQVYAHHSIRRSPASLLAAASGVDWSQPTYPTRL